MVRNPMSDESIKTILMFFQVKNFYDRKIQEGECDKQFEEEAIRADKKRAEGANMGPMPSPMPTKDKRPYIYSVPKDKVI